MNSTKDEFLVVLIHFFKQDSQEARFIWEYFLAITHDMPAYDITAKYVEEYKNQANVFTSNYKIAKLNFYVDSIKILLSWFSSSYTIINYIRIAITDSDFMGYILTCNSIFTFLRDINSISLVLSEFNFKCICLKANVIYELYNKGLLDNTIVMTLARYGEQTPGYEILFFKCLTYLKPFPMVKIEYLNIFITKIVISLWNLFIAQIYFGIIVSLCLLPFVIIIWIIRYKYRKK